MTETLAREVLNVEEAADFLGFSAYTVREKARTGDIPARKIGREWRFSRDVLLDWVKKSDSPKRAKVVIVVNENLDGTFTAFVQDDPSITGFGPSADSAVGAVAPQLERSWWNERYREELPANNI